MKNTLVIALVAILISSTVRCGSRRDVSPLYSAGCFSDDPLEKISWAKDQLQSFQRPRSGPLRVVIYDYKKERFLAFENVFLASPGGYIFDCSGVSIGKRGIHYNTFTDEAKAIQLLLEGTY